jgi:hypothetical protein
MHITVTHPGASVPSPCGSRYSRRVAGTCIPGIPAYFYPWPASRWWGQVAAMRPGTVIVANPASGPGEAINSRYASVIAAARERGLVVYGYVDSDYGAVDVESVVGQGRIHHSWYAVDGVFLDRTAPDDSSLPHYTAIADQLHDAGLSVAFNAGQPEVDRRYLDVADHVVLFEGPMISYFAARFPAWTHDVPSDRIWHLVYDVTTADAMQHVLAHAELCNAGMAFVTDGVLPSPWDHLPPYWELEQDQLAKLTQTR